MSDEIQRAWEPIRDGIVARFPMAVIEDTYALRFALTTAGDTPVRVGIRVRATNAYGEAVVVIAADLGHGDAIDPLAALAINALLVHGALAIYDGVLMLRAVVPASVQTPAAFELAVRKLAAEAAELKARLAPRAITNTAAFGHLAD